MKKPVLAIGLMSGTSLDGVDVALVHTDGDAFFEFIEASYLPYPHDMRVTLSAAATGDIPLDALLRLERRLTSFHVEAVQNLFNSDLQTKYEDIEVIGFHGQTIRHMPEEGLTWQLGDPQYLAAQVGKPVSSTTAVATPWAENTSTALSGTSLISSTKVTPRSSKSATTVLL